MEGSIDRRTCIARVGGVAAGSFALAGCSSPGGDGDDGGDGDEGDGNGGDGDDEGGGPY